MAQNVTVAGASYSDVPSVALPKTGGGTSSFFDVSDTTATASDVASGKYFYTSAGVRTAGTASGGGGIGTLIYTKSLGALSTTSTSAIDTGKTLTMAQTTGWQNYDLLIVDISVDSTTNNRHTSTVSFIFLTGTSDVSTKNTYAIGSNKWNSKLSSSGTASTRQSTTAYGVYIGGTPTVSSDTLVLAVYYRYNSNNTGTLNGTYTARVYGVKLYDLIGG
jgi:hypothetical protein